MKKRLLAILSTSLIAVGLAAAPAYAADVSNPGDPGSFSKPPKISAAQAATLSAQAKSAGTHDLKGQGPGQKGSAPDTQLRAALVDPIYYNYVYGRDADVVDGASANLTVHTPYVNSNVHHSLAEISVQSTLNTANRNAIEFGWTYEPGWTTGPRTFTYAWVNGSPKCYNGCGYVDLSTTVLNSGDPIPTTTPTAGKNFTIQYDATTPAGGGGWWIKYDGQWLGYWPSTVWSSAGQTFTTGSNTQWFGELATKVSNSCADMGTGVHGSAGASANPAPAYIGSASYITNSGIIPSLTYGATDATKWSYTGASTRTFFYGGPGYNQVVGGC